MDDFVPLGDVLLVLKAKGVMISAQDIENGIYLLAGNGQLEVRTLPTQVPKVELRYLARKFGVAIYLFWNTQMLEIKPGELQN